MNAPLKGHKSLTGSSSRLAKRYDDTLYSKDTVEVLLALSEGPVQGLKDGAASFYVGDVPLIDKGSNTPNISNFELRILKGTNPADSVVLNLGGTTSSKNVGLPLRSMNQKVVAQGDKTQIDYIDVRFVIQRLLIATDQGGEFPNQMSILIEVKPRSASEWQIPFTNEPPPPPVDSSGASNYRPGASEPGSYVNAAFHETYVAPQASPPQQATHPGAMWFVDDLDNWPPREWDGAAWQVPANLTSGIVDGFFVWTWNDLNGGVRHAWYSPNGEAPPPGSLATADWLLTPQSDEVVYSYNDISWVGTQQFQDVAPQAPGVISINGLARSSYVKEYRIAVARINEPYDVRVTRLDNPSDKSNFKDYEFESIQEINNDIRSYPDLALAHLTIKATDTFTQIPQFTGIYRGVIIPVPSNHVFNEDTQLSEFPGVWDGTFKLDYTNNPAWHAYNLIKNSRYGKNAYYPEVPDQWDYYEFGKHCSAHGFRFNEYIQEAQSLNELINYVVGVAGGVYVDRGDGYSTVIWDADDQPAVAIFAPENTIEGSFNYSFTDITERKNDFKVSFKNPELNYREDRVRVYDQNSMDVHGRNPEEFVAVGCRDATEAVKRGRLRLATSLTEKTIVNFKTNRQGRYLQPFQVILVADDQSSNVITGRVKSPVEVPAGTVVLPLRDQIYLEAGIDYSVQFTLSDPAGGLRVVTYPLQVLQPGAQSQLTLAQPLTDPLPEYAVFSIGSPKAFRITSIVQDDSEPDQIDITAMEVNRLKWAFVDGDVTLTDLTPLQTGSPSNYILPVSDAAINPEIGPDGKLVALGVTWSPSQSPVIRGYRVYHSAAGEPEQVIAETNDTYARIVDPAPTVHYVRIVAVSLDGSTESAPVTVQYTVADTTTVRSVAPPTGLMLVNEPEAPIFRAIDPKFSWGVSTDPLLAGYQVQVLTPAGAVVHTESVQGQPVFIYSLAQNKADNDTPLRAFTVRVRAVDTTGQFSAPVDLAVSHPAPPVVNPDIESVSETIFVTYDAPAGDFAGVLVWMETQTGYDPLQVAPRYDGPNTVVTLPVVPETTYFLRIAAYDSYGKTGLNIGPELAKKATITLFDSSAPALPSKPTLSSAAEIAADGGVTAVLRASWTNSTGSYAGRYTVAVAQGSGNFLEFPYSVDQGGTPAFELHGLQPGVQVQVKVRAIGASGFGQSDWSPVATITTAASTAVPDNPTGVVATGTYQGVSVSWNAPSAKDLDHVEVWSLDGTTSAGSPPGGASMRKVAAGTTYVYDNTVPASGQRTYWLRAVSTSGVLAAGFTTPVAATNPQIGSGAIGAGAVGQVQIVDGAISAEKIVTGAVTADKIFAGAVTTDKLSANAVTAEKIAAGAVTADKVTVGSTTLSSWVNGSDQTKIEGGSIAANSIRANSLKIGARGVQLVGVSFYSERNANGDLTGGFGWTAGQILVTADDGSPQAYAVPAALVGVDTGYWYVWWDKRQPSSGLHIGKDNWPDISNDAETILIATVSNLTGISVLVGGTIIDGTRITTGSIQADQIAANAIQAYHIAASSITADKLAAGSIAAEKIAAGTITAANLFLGSLNFQLNASNQLIQIYNQAGFEQVSIGRVGVFDGNGNYGIIIRDHTGQNVFKVNDDVAEINGAYIGTASIKNASIGDLQVDTIKIAGKAVSQTAIAGDDTVTSATVTIQPRDVTSWLQILAYRKGDLPNRHVTGTVPGALYIDLSFDLGATWELAHFGVVNTYFTDYDKGQGASWIMMGATTFVNAFQPKVTTPVMIRARDDNAAAITGVYLSVTELAR